MLQPLKEDLAAWADCRYPPNCRTPRDILDAEINRILDLGDIEVVLNKRVGKDIPMDEVEQSHDAVFMDYWLLE